MPKQSKANKAFLAKIKTITVGGKAPKSETGEWKCVGKFVVPVVTCQECHPKRQQDEQSFSV